MGGEQRVGRGGATWFSQQKRSHKLRGKALPPPRTSSHRPCAPSRPRRWTPSGSGSGAACRSHWAAPRSALKPKQRTRLHRRNGSPNPHLLTPHQTSAFGWSPPSQTWTRTASHFFEVLQKHPLVQNLTFKIAFMCRLVDYSPLKSLLLSAGLSCYGLDISQKMGKHFYLASGFLSWIIEKIH